MRAAQIVASALLLGHGVAGCGATSSLDEGEIRADAGCATPSSAACVGLNVQAGAFCGPASVVRGQPFAFDFVVRNAGTLSTPQGVGSETQSWIGAFLISTDADITSGDLRIGAFTTQPALQPGAEWRSSDVAEPPVDLAPGTYHFALMLDPFDKLDEVNEADNIAAYCTSLSVQ